MPDIIKAHLHSTSHRQELLSSQICGCFCCLTIFDPKEVTQWVDGPVRDLGSPEIDMGTTAICPHCGIDSVIGDKSGFPISRYFLAKMRQYWFKGL